MPYRPFFTAEAIPISTPPPGSAAMNPLDISEAQFRELAVRNNSLAADYYGRLPRMPAFPTLTGNQTQNIFDQPPA
ncbi:MAG: hypothetical protein JO042_13150 [Sinobacteraceae bacterium]|nr:hypothetical protein [Nevskiaceae bacterium]